MKHTGRIGGVMLLSGIVALAGTLIFKNDVRLKFSESQIQEKISDAFPVEGSRLLVRYRVTDPVVTLRDDQKIEWSGRVNVSIAERAASGKLTVASAIDYNPMTGGFYLVSPELIAYEISEFTTKTSDKALALGALKQLSKKITGDEQAYEKVWAENQDGIKHGLMERVERTVAARPIYTLTGDDVKTSAARLMLRDVVVSGEEISVVLSLRQGLFIAALYIMAGLGALLMAVGLMRSGGAGVLPLLG